MIRWDNDFNRLSFRLAFRYLLVLERNTLGLTVSILSMHEKTIDDV